MTISVYRGEVFTVALISAFATAIAIFLAWAFGREIDPAHHWSAFTALPMVYAAMLVIGRPSLLALLFLILSCRLLNRTSGRLPFKSDSILLLVMGLLLYFNNLYFALPYLALCFLTDALAKPVNSFQLFLTLVTSTAYLTLLFLVSPELTLLMTGAMPAIYPVASVITVALSAIYISSVTRPEKVLDDLEQEELNCFRVKAARFLAAAWVVSEIFFGGVDITLQIYPAVIVFGGILLYHLAARFFKIWQRC